MAQRARMDFREVPRPTTGKNTSEFPAPEVARLFCDHLLDNIGQFQPLYDGLFRWKMNNLPSLPSFEAVRPYLTHFMRSVQNNSNAGVEILHAASRNTTNGFVEAGKREDLFRTPTDYLSYKSGETPFESASECAYDDDGDRSIEIDDRIYNSLYGMYLNDTASIRDEEPFTRSDMTDEWVCREVNNGWNDTWIGTDDDDNVEADFDFERNLSAFTKLPLNEEKANAAKNNSIKQETAIQQLLKRTIGAKDKFRPIQ